MINHPLPIEVKAVLKIGDFLILITLGLVALILAVSLYRGDPFVQTLLFALILTVAAIPVALPAVLSVTMAVGASVLARMQAIVSRLASIEEMAGMDILCSDKTGTLTKNELELGKPVVFKASSAQDLILAASLASPEEGQDGIDQAVLKGLSDLSALKSEQITHFTPFDPVSKRTEAVVKHDSVTFKVSKGAPQVILDLVHPEGNARKKAESRLTIWPPKAIAPLASPAPMLRASGNSLDCCRCQIRLATIPLRPSWPRVKWACRFAW